LRSFLGWVRCDLLLPLLHGSGAAKASLGRCSPFLHPKRLIDAYVRFKRLCASVQTGSPVSTQPDPLKEPDMNAQYNASSRPARSVIAMLACVMSVTVLASIGGLAEHYSDQAQVASAKPVAVAQR